MNVDVVLTLQASRDIKLFVSKTDRYILILLLKTYLYMFLEFNALEFQDDASKLIALLYFHQHSK